MTATPDLDAAVAAEVHRRAALRGIAEGLTVVEYVVVAAAAGWDDQGREVCQVVVMPSGMPHRIGGLLNDGKLWNDAQTMAAYMSDD